MELSAVFAVAQSLGRSPLVVLREAEKLLEEAKRLGVALLPQSDVDRKMEKSNTDNWHPGALLRTDEELMLAGMESLPSRYRYPG
jgi:hypothetical protein